MKYINLIVLAVVLALPGKADIIGKHIHRNVPFLQDFSIKYYFSQLGVSPKKVAADRNGKIQVLSTDGLLHPHDGAFLYPGTPEPDKTYCPMADKNIADFAAWKNQLVYLDDEAVLSNAWAGKLFSEHQMPEAKLFAGGENFTFLIADGKNLKLLNEREQLWKGKTSEAVIELKYAPATEKLLIHLKFKNNNHEKNRYMFNSFCAGTYSRSTEFI